MQRLVYNGAMRHSLSDQIINWKGWFWRKIAPNPLNIVKSCPCEFWFDGQDTSTIALNFNRVIQWDDKSGFDRHVANAVDAQRPTYDPVTGRITFVAANSTYLQLANFIAPLAQPVTIFILYRKNALNLIAIHNIFTGGNAYATSIIFYIQLQQFRFWAGADMINGAIDQIDHIHSAEANGVISNYWIDGVLVVGPANSGVQPLDGITLGSSPILNNFFDGEIMEVFGYNCLLTPAERTALDAYLTSKWGL